MSLIISKDKSSETHIGEIIVKSGDSEKLPGVKTDSKLYFWWSYKKANKKSQALAPAIS